MLRRRLLVSAVLIPGSVGLAYADTLLGPRAPVLFLFALFVALRSARELSELLGGQRPSQAVTMVCIVGLITAHWLPHFVRPERAAEVALVDALGPCALAYTGCLLAIFSRRVIVYTEPGGHLATLGAEVLVVSYAGMLVCATTQLRWVGGGELGYLAIGSLVIATKAGDAAAYVFGRLFGRSKLAPKLSPGKTKTGAAWSIIVASGATAAWLGLATPVIAPQGRLAPLWLLLIYGALVGLAGIAGDLCESLLKRSAGRKDAADLVPGMGGLIDVVDSPLYAGPVALLCWESLGLVRL
ncbi:MAG: phosphatidate cytidylyltransferase [Planctomycetota bacterium]